jgi:hypothetical protein
MRSSMFWARFFAGSIAVAERTFPPAAKDLLSTRCSSPVLVL